VTVSAKRIRSREGKNIRGHDQKEKKDDGLSIRQKTGESVASWKTGRAKDPDGEAVHRRRRSMDLSET